MKYINGKEIIEYRDDLYYIERTFPGDQIKEGYINKVKDAWNCDIVLKKTKDNKNTLLFLVKIPDAIIIDN